MSHSVSGVYLHGQLYFISPVCCVSFGNKLPGNGCPDLRAMSCGISQGGKSELITVSAGQSIDSTTQECPGGGLTETDRLTSWPRLTGGRWETIVAEGRRRSDLELLL